MAKPSVPPAIESPLVIASNRGPVTFEPDGAGGFEPQRGAGGLVTTLSGVFYRDEATWVSAALSDADRIVPDEAAVDESIGLQLRFVSLDPDVYEGYYNEIANGVLWFTSHFLWDIARAPVFDAKTDEAWSAYEKANRAFAEVLDAAPADAVFLIQDYHLSLVPRYLRDLRPNARIVHFSHVPHPGQTYVRLLPVGVRESLVRGVAGADVIGFQTRTWAENFLLSARALAGREGGPASVPALARWTHVARAPVPRLGQRRAAARDVRPTPTCGRSGPRSRPRSGTRSCCSAWTASNRRRTSCAASGPTSCSCDGIRSGTARCASSRC